MNGQFGALTGTYDFRLLALSAILAILVPHAGVEIVDRIRATQERVRGTWIIIGGAAFGIGLVGEVYVGVCSWQLPLPVYTHYPTLLLALLAAIVSAGLGVLGAVREYKNVRWALPMSCLTALTGTSVPYLCLASFRMAAEAQYRWWLIAASAASSILVVLFVLVLDVSIPRLRSENPWKRLLTSSVIAIPLLLLTLSTQYAVRFSPRSRSAALGHTFPQSFHSSLAVAAVALLVLSGIILTSILHRLLSSRKEMFAKARERETFFNNLSEAIPGIVWIADANGKTTYINHHWYEMTGTDPNREVGFGWMDSIHPDDREALTEKWVRCMRSGETFEIEYRLLDAVHGYRWYLDRAVPLKDEKGNIQQWFGTCTDIEQQKHYQQDLEKQIIERTEELADANARLKQEMTEKDLAQQKLNEQTGQMMSELKERSHRATLLAKMGELLQSCLTREEVFTAALGFAPKIFPDRRGAIALFNASRTLVEVTGQWHDCQLPVTSFESEGCWALRTGHLHLVSAGDTTAPCSHAVGLNCSYVCVPILAQGEALGILHVQATEERPDLSEVDVSFKTTFAAQVGLSVANIRLRDALRAQSTKDPLTGLYNRRYLAEMLEREIRRAVRAEQPLGLLMLDLDHFKKFNDTYGHDAGDAVLRETASFLIRSIRAEDFVCRYGGEEFVIVLPTADLRIAGLRAEAIRSRIRDLVVMHQGRSVGLVTLSIGVAALPQHGATEKDLLQAADAALYRAKSAGRDRVVLAELTPRPDTSAADAAASCS